LIVTVDPGLQVGPFNVLTGPIKVGLKGAVAIAPAVATAPPATAPAVPTAAATGPGPACFALFFFAANAGETDIAATTTQHAIVFIVIGVPSDKATANTIVGAKFHG
jgi:hypothetical protein